MGLQIVRSVLVLWCARGNRVVVPVDWLSGLSVISRCSAINWV